MRRTSNKGLELPQRQPPRLRKPGSLDTDQHTLLHNRPITERTPRLTSDRRSPRNVGSHSDPLNQKKLGTRISDLESQLGQAQDELRLLKGQLATTEAAKKQVQAELNKKSQRSKPQRSKLSTKKNENVSRDEVPGDAQQETDVFEVPVEKLAVEKDLEESKVETAATTQITDLEGKEAKVVDFSNNPGEKISSDDLGTKEDEITLLKAKLYNLEQEKETLRNENESLKDQLNDSASRPSDAKVKEEEIASDMTQTGKEIEESKTHVSILKEKLEATEEAKEALETEMKRLRIQTEQWRKAADAAAAVLAGEADMKSKVSERFGSMDNNLVGGYFDPTAGNDGYTGLTASPGLAEDSDDGFGSGKRRSSGIKKLGDLWKKKGQK